MVFSDKAYNIIKWICLTVLPAISVFISALGTIYGWDVTSIVLTVNAIAVLVGTLTGVSSINYAKQLENENEVG